MSTLHKKSIELVDFSPSTGNFAEEIWAGLQKHPKRLSPKFFYDQIGSELFEKITALPEYYVTRSELSIIQRYAGEMVAMMGKSAALIEFGSGSSTKVKCLLNENPELSYYIPIDIAKEMLLKSSEMIKNEYEKINVLAICADFTASLRLPALKSHSKKVIFYPGSTIGNFEPLEAKLFLSSVRRMLNKGDGFLIGVDLEKDPNILNQAYNDKSGVTAAFNLNLLNRINRQLNADFKLDAFCHHAFYNENFKRIEMHIKSLQEQSVSMQGQQINFTYGETIHTENSYKYTIKKFQKMAIDSGFAPIKVWTDENEWFSVHYLQVKE